MLHICIAKIGYFAHQQPKLATELMFRFSFNFSLAGGGQEDQRWASSGASLARSKAV
jgi:hypothetical protein